MTSATSGSSSARRTARINGPAPTRPRPETAVDALERAAAEYLRRVDRVQQLVVLRTGAGQAQPLAIALDRAQLSEAVGTIAGDDTILVIGRGARGAAALVKRLKDYIQE